MRFVLISKQCLGMLAVIALAFPVWARSPKLPTFTADWFTDHAMKIGNIQIETGHYTLSAQEDKNTLDVMRDGKMVAQVPCQWVQLSKKAANTEIESDNNQVTEVEFAGKTEAVEMR